MKLHLNIVEKFKLQAERRRNLGLPSEDHSSKKITKHLQKQQNTKISDEHVMPYTNIRFSKIASHDLFLVSFNMQNSSTISSATTVDNLQECLRSLKQNHLVNKKV